MSRSRCWVRRAAVLLTMALLPLLAPRLSPGVPLVAAQPAPPSSLGCTTLNLLPLDSSYRSSGGQLTFVAGDRITISAGPPTNFGTPTTIAIVVDDVAVATTTFPGTLTYTFPAGSTGTHGFVWTSQSADVTWTVACIPAVDTTAPELQISIDPTTKDVRVEAVDDGYGVATPNPITPTACTAVRTSQQVCLYRATDTVGNSVTATLHVTKQSGQTQVVVQRLQYSGKPASTPLTNSLVATFAPTSSVPTQFHQTAQVIAPGTPATARKVTANWTAAAGTTTVMQVTPVGPTQTCGGSSPTPVALQTQAGALQIRMLCLV